MVTRALVSICFKLHKFSKQQLVMWLINKLKEMFVSTTIFGFLLRKELLTIKVVSFLRTFSTSEMVMMEIFHGFQGELQIGGRIVTNLRYADDIILLATSEAELQELVDPLDRVSCKYSLLIDVDNIINDHQRAAYSFRMSN